MVCRSIAFREDLNVTLSENVTQSVTRKPELAPYM